MTQVTIEQALETAVRLHQEGRWAEAEEIYWQILERQPGNADVLHLVGILCGQLGRLEESVALIRQAIAIDPNVTAYHNNLGESYRRLEQLDQAAAAFHQAIGLDSENAQAHSNLSAVLRDQKMIEQSIAAARKAIAIAPDYAEAYNNLGNALLDQGRWDDAIAACRKAIQLKPDLPEAHNNLGNVLLILGRFDEAIEAFGAAIALKPDFHTARVNLGSALRSARRFDEAIAAYAAAIHLKPDSADDFYNLAITLRDMGKLGEAIAAYSKTIELQPNHAEAHNNLGNAMRFHGRLDEATAAFAKAIELKPDYAEAYNNLGGARTDQGRLDDALECFAKAIALKPDLANVHSNLVYTIHFHPGYDAAEILRKNRHWAQIHEAPLAGEIRPHVRDNDKSPRPLKVGYVSPDFRLHAAACYLLPLLTHHDRENVEVFCYAGVKRPDDHTRRFQELGHHWRNTVGLSDAELAEKIRGDQIDILVDLTLHMADNRLLTFARKPAPVQVTWLGYPSTTGLTTIDYRLTDPHLDPPGQGDEFYSERSIRLPRTFWCYQPLIETTPDVNSLPALDNGYITFGCFNNFAKVTQGTLQTWARILEALPDSRLLIQSLPGSHLQDARKIFEDTGVAAHRLEFVSRLQPAEYFQLYHRIDLALDPMPYPGHTSSLDALWMGVPSITLSGRTAVSRGGASILSNIGMPEFIAATPGQYVSIAIEQARDIPRLAKLRADLRQKLRQSPLMEARQFAADIEAAYLQMWQNHWHKPETLAL